MGRNWAGPRRRPVGVPLPQRGLAAVRRGFTDTRDFRPTGRRKSYSGRTRGQTRFRSHATVGNIPKATPERLAMRARTGATATRCSSGKDSWTQKDSRALGLADTRDSVPTPCRKSPRGDIGLAKTAQAGPPTWNQPERAVEDGTRVDCQVGTVGRGGGRSNTSPAARLWR